MLGAVVSVLLLGVIDWATGYEISFSVFYVFPIGATAWVVGKRPALLLAVVSAAVWETSNRLAGEQHSSPVVPLWNASTRLAFFVIILLLLARLRELLEHERSLSQSDPLTAVQNSRAFYASVTQHIERMRRLGGPMALAYIDLDNFKRVNDQLGHAAGDALLREVAQCLRSELRVIDQIARLGGDEFAVLLVGSDGPAACRAVQRALTALRRATESHGWNVEFSVGVCVWTRPPESVEAMVHAADAAMYSAKRAGKGTIRLVNADGTPACDECAAKPEGAADVGG